MYLFSDSEDGTSKNPIQAEPTPGSSCYQPNRYGGEETNPACTQLESFSNTPSKTSLSRFNESSETDASCDSESENDTHEQVHDAAAQQLGYFICPNENDPIGIKKAFMEKHPIQVTEMEGEKMPFEPSKLYYRSLSNADKIHRKWLL